MDTTSQVYITMEAIVGGLSVIGNGMVLFAIYRTPRLQTITNCFIASLALADFLVGIVVAPLAALSFLGLPHNFYGCVFTNSIVIAFTQVSIFSLVTVAFERFIAIKNPFFYQDHLTIKKALIVNAVTWLLGFLIGLIPLFGWNLSHLKGEDWRCNFVTVIDMAFVVYFHFFGCILVPLLLMFGVYSYIFYIVRKQTSQIAALEIHNNTNRSQAAYRFKKEIKAAKSLLLVLVLFAICWIPIHSLNSMTQICGASCPYPLELLLATIVLSHANSAINPFLYAYGNSNFKHAFQKMFCGVTENDFVTNHQSNTNHHKHSLLQRNHSVDSQQSNGEINMAASSLTRQTQQSSVPSVRKADAVFTIQS